MKRLLDIPLGIPILLAAWIAASWAGVNNPLVLPSVKAVGSSLMTQLSQLGLWHDTAMTSLRACVGLALSALVGIPVGLLLGYFPKVYRHVSLPLDIVRSIPSATLFPVFILAFGIGDLAKVAVVFYGCFFIMIMAAVYGGRGNPDRQRRIRTLVSLRASRLQIFRFVVLPDAMGNILAGLRISTSIAFVLVVVTEMFLGSNDGLGKRIYDYYLAYRIPDLYATLLMLGLLGYVANTSIERIERKYKSRQPTEGN